MLLFPHYGTGANNELTRRRHPSDRSPRRFPGEVTQAVASDYQETTTDRGSDQPSTPDWGGTMRLWGGLKCGAIKARIRAGGAIDYVKGGGARRIGGAYPKSATEEFPSRLHRQLAGSFRRSSHPVSQCVTAACSGAEFPCSELFPSKTGDQRAPGSLQSTFRR